MKRPSSFDIDAPKRPKVLGHHNGNLPSPPVTPEKHRVVDLSKHLEGASRKKLAFSSVYSRAKALFQRSCAVDVLVGRTAEARILQDFILVNVSRCTSASLYVSGPPGTGKTAQVEAITKKLAANGNCINNKSFKSVAVNCMAVSKPDHIFHEIYSQISGTAGGHRRHTYDDLQGLLKVLSLDSVVVVLDELDSLITRDQQVLFQLFNCAQFQRLPTKLIVIGISNALDLTDKFLPRLKSNGLDPQALQFLPYTASQINQIIIHKLKLLVDEDKENIPASGIPIMHPMAVQLCCKKSASVTGDLRKAFDICYKAIELVEATTQDQNYTPHTAPKVLISHIATVCNHAFGNDTALRLSNLNLLQKAVLCCLFAYQISHTTYSTTSLNDLFDFYSKQTKKVDNLITRLRKGEFLEIVGALESSSVVTLNNSLIKPNVPYDELVKSVGSVGVLKSLLTID